MSLNLSPSSDSRASEALCEAAIVDYITPRAGVSPTDETWSTDPEYDCILTDIKPEVVTAPNMDDISRQFNFANFLCVVEP